MISFILVAIGPRAVDTKFARPVGHEVKRRAGSAVSNLCISTFEFVSDFEIRILVFVLLCALLLSPSAVTAEGVGELQVQSFFRSHCIMCHGPEKHEADLRLDQLSGNYDPQSIEKWRKIFTALHQGDMPPEPQPAPPQQETQHVLSWMKDYFVGARKAAGSGSFRRLNRREISNSLDDLFDLNIDFTHLLPPDGLKEDFDNRAETLRISDTLLETYLDVTRRVVNNTYIAGERSPSKEHRFDFVELSKDPKQAGKQSELSSFSIEKYLTPEGLRIFPITPLFGGPLDNSVRGGKYAASKIILNEIDQDGLVRIEVKFHAGENDNDRIPRLIIFLNSREVAEYNVTGTRDQPQVAVLDYYVEDLPSKKNEQGKVILGIGFNNIYPQEGGRGQGGDEYKNGTSVYIQSVEAIDGYQVQRPLTDERDADQPLSPAHENELVRAYLTRFLSQAYRRPVGDVSKWMARYQSFRQSGASISDSLRACMQVALSSPDFLYLASPEGLQGETLHHAIASRLSYFLWSSSPDQKLLDLAQEQQLLDPRVLDGQVERMLQHPNADRFYRNYALRWTGLQRLDVPFDEKDTWYRAQRYVEQAMQDEAVAFFREVVERNLSADQFLDSDFAMRNDVMAAYLGYPGKFNASFQRVSLQADDPRGGLLGQAGIMALTGNGKPPITRGVWMLRKVLDDPPPDPPLNVPDLNAKDPSLSKKPLREQLRVHQEHADCAVCHRKIDPLGFAFEQFDATGRWVEFGKRGKENVRFDTAGHMPRGETFQTLDEMKQLLRDEYQHDFARGLTKNLLAYAVGRELHPEDLETVDVVLQQFTSKQYPVKDIIKALVQSDAFSRR